MSGAVWEEQTVSRCSILGNQSTVTEWIEYSSKEVAQLLAVQQDIQV